MSIDQAREKRKKRIRKRVFGTAERPRLSVFRSARHIYAQLVNDELGSTLMSASTLVGDVKKECEGKSKTEAATVVGAAIARACKEKAIEAVVFDRNGFRYHGRIKALADAAREQGLSF